MKFSVATLFALGLLAGNVVSAPTLPGRDVALPIEVRAEDFVANDAGHLEARAKKRGNGAKAAGAKAKGAAGKGKNNAAAAKKNAGKNNGAAANAKKNKNNNNNAKKNNNNNNAAKNNNNNNNANAGKGKGKSQAEFNGLACTDGKGAGSCNAQGQCAVNGKTTQIAGQCGVAAAKKANKRFVSDVAHLI
ncbi:hypothetical protein CSOJ01_13780 [Colletotrichum sojae]|uniref:Uncharacterized protein n=1 Tax=Colletotrichum sojae TaxID=2175907 RepID=A0A8H6IS72_9PEZI|nr:hypothetical protein CSOJ01_13780 [Colletotrichum sojae]